MSNKLNLQLLKWVLMPGLILVSIYVSSSLYKLSHLELTNTIHCQGTICQIEKDLHGYKGRTQYKIRLKQYQEEFYLINNLVEKARGVDLIATGMEADLYYYTDQSGQNDIIALQVNNQAVLDLSVVTQHYKRMFLINIAGVTLFSVLFGVILYNKRTIKQKRVKTRSRPTN